MPTTLTLKNISDEVYKRLKTSAELHRRSLNSEVILCLETMFLPNKSILVRDLCGRVSYVVG